jgi:hypothetical protein
MATDAHNLLCCVPAGGQARPIFLALFKGKKQLTVNCSCLNFPLDFLHSIQEVDNGDVSASK